MIDAATPLQAQTAFDQLEGTLSARIGPSIASLLDVIARLEASLDFPDEGFHFIEPRDVVDRVSELLAESERVARARGAGRMIREGATVVIAGRVNAGKSSLFNALDWTRARNRDRCSRARREISSPRRWISRVCR